MRFAEAEQKYHELEEKLVRGELSENDFVTQVAELRLVDEEGHRWMLSGKSGRWLVHDGQQWVFAEPPRDVVKAELGVRAELQAEARTEAQVEEATVAATVPDKSPPPQPTGSRPIVPRLLAAGIVTILLLGCLFGGGVATWVFVLRNVGEPASVPTDEPVAALVKTYTPGPVTPTYTPTFTPTPSRTPTPTETPMATDTPIATDTPVATPTPIPTNPPLPTATKTPAPSTPTREPTIASPTPTSSVAPTIVSRISPTPASSQTYTVKAGDTLSGIAASFGVSARALADANGLTNASLIRPGQTLVIPAPGTSVTPSVRTYTVTVGDTLFDIAIRFGLSAKALAEANGITNTALIRPGQVLVIPAAETAAAAAGLTPTPTWTPIALVTPAATTTSRATPMTAVATSTPTPTATKSGPTSTPKPTNTPKPTAIPTARPVALSGKIAFTLWNPYIGKYELYVSQIDGNGRNMLGEGFRQPQFRPDGNLLAINGEGAQNLEHLVTMNPSGGDRMGVSQHSEDSFPAWSPDGAIVAFSSDSWGDGKTRLGIVHDMFGAQQQWIPIGSLQVEGEYPFWMADGRVVYHGCDLLSGGGNCGLYWVGAGGGSYHRVSDHDSDTAPAGAGARVAFMSARDGNWEIYVADLNGGATKRLTNNGAQDGLPTWSPDGTSIAFVSDRDGAWAIWVMNANGEDQRKLFDLGGGYGTGDHDWTHERISWAP